MDPCRALSQGPTFLRAVLAPPLQGSILGLFASAGPPAGLYPGAQRSWVYYWASCRCSFLGLYAPSASMGVLQGPILGPYAL